MVAQREPTNGLSWEEALTFGKYIQMLAAKKVKKDEGAGD